MFYINRNKKRNPLKQIDLHGLRASEALEYTEESIKTVKEMLNAEDITPEGDDHHMLQIITVKLFRMVGRRKT